MHCMPQWLQVSAMDVSKFFVKSMLLVRWTIIDRNNTRVIILPRPRLWNTRVQSNTPQKFSSEVIQLRGSTTLLRRLPIKTAYHNR